MGTPGLKKWLLSRPVTIISLHVPFMSGVPPSPSKRSTVFWPEQMVKVPLVPALGAWVTVTVTVALSGSQGAVPVTLYLYTKVPAADGRNTPLLVAPPGPVHVPPASGVPPKLLKRLTGSSVLHSGKGALVPATGLRCWVTVTTAEALAHGLRPATVYV